MGNRSKIIMDSIGLRIKYAREQKELTQKQLGAIVNKGDSTVRMWELGKSEPDLVTLNLIAKALDVDTAYLLGNSPYKSFVYTVDNIYPVDNIISFEVLGSVRAGYDGIINEISTGETIDLPLSMISGGHKDEYFVLQVTGNSMFPRLLDGDKILCKRTNSVDSGSLAVIIYNGDDATVKKVNFVSGEDWLELVPFNPEYETRRIEGRDLEQCRVIGKVVKLIRDL